MTSGLSSSAPTQHAHQTLSGTLQVLLALCAELHSARDAPLLAEIETDYPQWQLWLQGDVLSGTLAAFRSWAVNNPESAEDAARKLGLRPDLLACWGACTTVRQV
jgi:hypothetical protein